MLYFYCYVAIRNLFWQLIGEEDEGHLERVDHERNYENNYDQDPTNNMLDVENVDEEMAENISEV